MPFFKLAFENEITLNSVSDETPTPIPSSNDVPIFLIPSLGDGTELFSLAEALNQAMDGKSSIYIYFDSLSAESFQDKSYSIAYAISHLSCVFHPAIMISDSLGCSLTLEAADNLKNMKRDTFLYLIDGAPAALYKEFFFNERLESTLYLWNAIKKAAERSSLNIPKLTDDELNDLSKEILEKRITLLSKKIIIHQPQDGEQDNLNNFDKLMHTTKNYFMLLNHYEPTPLKKIKHNLHAFLTKKTTTTLKQSFCGWHEYALRLSNINKLEFYTCTDILSEQTQKLAHKIVDNISKQLSKKYLLKNEWLDTCNILMGYHKKIVEMNNQHLNNSEIANLESTIKVLCGLIEKLDLNHFSDDETSSLSKNLSSFFLRQRTNPNLTHHYKKKYEIEENVKNSDGHIKNGIVFA